MPSSLKYRHKQLLIQLKDIEETKTDTSAEERTLLNFTKQLEQSTNKHDNDIEELKTRLASIQTKIAVAEREKQAAILWHRNHIEKVQSEIEVKKNPKKSLRYKKLMLDIEDIREQMLSARKNTLERTESLQPFEEEWIRAGGFEVLKLSLKDYQDNKYRLQDEERERVAELAEQERKERASKPRKLKQAKKAEPVPLTEEETIRICVKELLKDIVDKIVLDNF